MEKYNFDFEMVGATVRERNKKPMARLDVVKYGVIINLNKTAKKFVDGWQRVDVGFDKEKNVVALRQGTQRKVCKQNFGVTISAAMLRDIVTEPVQVECHKENDMVIIDLEGGKLAC